MLIVFVVCIGAYFSSGVTAVYSAMLGGSLFAIPQLYFGYKAFQVQGARRVHQVVTNIYRGVSTKILVIACGFAVIFKFVQPLHTGFLFGTFIVVLVVNACSPMLVPYFEPAKARKAGSD